MLPTGSVPNARAASYSGRRAINYIGRAADGRVVQMGRTGLASQLSLGAEVRNILPFNGGNYAVANGGLWSVPDGAFLGAVTDETTSMAATATEIGIVAGGTFYLYSVSGGLTTPSTGITAPTSVEALNNTFYLTGTSGSRSDAIAASDVLDGSTWNGLAVAFAEGNEDAILTSLRVRDQLWFFGTETVQIFTDVGATPFPLQPIPGATLSVGCSEGGSVAKIDDTVLWVGTRGRVWASTGVSPREVSTPEVIEEINSRTIAGALTIYDRGAPLYILNFTTGTSLVFNLRTGEWSEFATGGDYGPWIGVKSVQGETQYIGTTTGKICTLSGYDDDGTEIPARLVTDPLFMGQAYQAPLTVESYIEGGVDFTRDAQAVLEVSRDGETWGIPKQRTFGGAGKHYRRARWNHLGAGRADSGGRLQVRHTITDPVPRDVYGLFTS